MPATEFLDSNVLVYAYDTTHPGKQLIAQGIVSRAVAGEIVASAQVLGEFASTLLHKLSPPARAQDVLAILNVLEPIKLVCVDAVTVQRAVEARATYGVHFYDGLILASAERGGCHRIWSEDFNFVQKYFDIEISNPFA